MLENSKFTKIDEEFICENCGRKVPKLGYTCRNHCPHCLHSKHLDINPGDRAEDCHGMLEPIALEINSKKGYIIVFKCKKCGEIRKNKAAEDDNMDEIIALSAKEKRILELLSGGNRKEILTNPHIYLLRKNHLLGDFSKNIKKTLCFKRFFMLF